MKAVVDRIEEGIAVIHFEKQDTELHVPIEQLPENTREGSWLRLNFSPDENQTNQMYNRIRDLLEKVKGRQKE